MSQAVLYQLQCVADADFYDALARWDDGDARFDAAKVDAPPGWSRSEEGIWVGLWPHGRRLPTQGWKVHVSAGLDNAADVLAVVWEYCLTHRIAFKFQRSPRVLHWTNSKYADRSSGGKFCTLYPADEPTLKSILDELGTALDGQPGPYVLSDLRWRNGPLYLRYGGFVARYCVDESGDQVPAVRDPDGTLVPDQRQPVFRVPAWAPMPGFLSAQIAERNSRPPTDFPYRIRRALHFSNGGGVYLAVDSRSDRQVVLKEARPLAGLDTDGVDAVSRIEQERAALQRLSGIAAVPQLLDAFTYWEHRFLVLEYVEGESLPHAVSARHPLVLPDATDREVGEYAAWVEQICTRVEHALRAIHARGLAVNDLHPSNILTGPAGRVTVLDFELAAPADRIRRHGLAAPGFVPPPGCTGTEGDHTALACLKLWMYFPFATLLLARDADKTSVFTEALTQRFRLSRDAAVALGRRLRTAYARDGQPARRPRISRPAATALGAPAPADWPALRDALATAITSSATPRRPDRLFPGDVAQTHYGGSNLAYGAAGVLYALARTGVPVDPDHLEWLVRATRRIERPYPGLYNGLAGIAYVLDLLGQRGEALSTLDRAMELSTSVHSRGLFGGLAGIGLSLLHFARITDDNALHARAEDIAHRLADPLRADTASPDLPEAAGLMYGLSGSALFFLHYYRRTHDSTFLDLASTALRRDLDFCLPGPRHTLQVRQGHRLLPYLGVGSVGVGLIVRAFLCHRRDEQLVHAEAGIRNTCRSESALFPGLFTGHAGLMAYLAADQSSAAQTAAHRHRHRLSWFTEPYCGGLAFLGDQLLRLSMDLATGTSGVLLALQTVLDRPRPFLPFLDLDIETATGTATAPSSRGTPPD
jgi:tRNA A-37 threonylcarbamoyl transferase component Bud32